MKSHHHVRPSVEITAVRPDTSSRFSRGGGRGLGYESPLTSESDATGCSLIALQLGVDGATLGAMRSQEMHELKPPKEYGREA